MPVLESTYRPPWWLPGGHLQTVVPALFRRHRLVTTRAERLELADGDFLDLLWHATGAARLAILSHGLEGNARAPYIQSTAAHLIDHGWDVLAWNFRGCGDEPNRLARFYHSGATDDLAAAIDHAHATHPAGKIDLIGFSLGGNLTLKYLGERAAGLPPRLHRAATFSVPCDLADSAEAMTTWLCRTFYMRRFLRTLARKIHAKHRRFPGEIDPRHLRGIDTFRGFDDRYTAPLHGFRDAADYWERSSSRPFLPRIEIPTLLVNAGNDPFLGPACHPHDEARGSRHFHFEQPPEGGHVGFPDRRSSPVWTAARAHRFLAVHPP